MSKIRCFIGDHKTLEDFVETLLGTLIIRLCGDFMKTLLGTLWGDFTNHKTFEDFFVVLYRYIVIFCYI